MIAQTLGVYLMDDCDDLLPLRQRRAVPPFPWDSLRNILTLGGDYSSDTTAKQVPMATHRMFDGIRFAALEHAQYGPVMTAIQRAFGENRVRHNLTEKCLPLLFALEAGLVLRPDRRGIPRWVLWSSERPDAMVPDREAAVLFGLSESTVREYHRLACKAVTDEWIYLWSGWEK